MTTQAQMVDLIKRWS